MSDLSPHPIDTALTAIAFGYKNKNYIADMVAPRVMVPSQRFSFMQFKDESFYQMPESRVGRRSTPEELNLESIETPDFCEDHGFDGGVPLADEMNAAAYKSVSGGRIYNPMDAQVMQLSEALAIVREKRVADIANNPVSYDPALQILIPNGQKFNEAGGDPISVITESADMPLLPPNQMIFSRPVWTKFRKLPQIVEAIKGTGADQGLVTRQQVAELFEMEEVLVGDTRGNISRPGQPANLSRLWGNNIILAHKSAVMNATDAPTFMATFEWGMRSVTSWFEKNMGVRGGTKCRVYESVRERVVASQGGFLIRAPFL